MPQQTAVGPSRASLKIKTFIRCSRHGSFRRCGQSAAAMARGVRPLPPSQTDTACRVPDEVVGADGDTEEGKPVYIDGVERFGLPNETCR